MTHLSVSLLGSLQITLDNQPVLGGNSRKSQALLAYLAEDPGKAQPRSTLAGLLWPEHLEQAALNDLRQALFKLRHAIQKPGLISPFLLVNHESITFNLHSDCSIDTHDFYQMVSAATGAKQPVAAEVHLLDQAVRLYRGEFLEAFSLEDSPIFEDWILSRREFYRTQALEALTRLAEASLAQGDTFQVKEYARQQIKIDPCLEDVHGYLMQALALEGKRSQALAQYHLCCSLLEKELNVGPGPGIIQLFERIRDGDLASGQVTWAGPVA